MIYVSEDQLDQVEYIIGQSIQGNHVLFDSNSVKEVLRESAEEILTEEEAYEVEPHIEKLILQNTLAQKRAYLEGLDTGTYKRVIRTYFNIVENNIYESTRLTH